MDKYTTVPEVVLAARLSRDTWNDVLILTGGRTFTTDQSIQFGEGYQQREIEVGQWIVKYRNGYEILDDVDFQLKFEKVK